VGLPVDDAGRRAFLTGALLASGSFEARQAVEQNARALNAAKTEEERATAQTAFDRALAGVGPYLGHELTFERGRPVHGRGHIARCYLYASAFCGILEEKGVTVDRNAVLLGVGGHDMGRKGGGQDKWEENSASLLVGSLRQSFGADAMGGAYENALKACITDKTSHTAEAMIVDSADCLDISRIRQPFDMNKLRFLRDQDGAISSEGDTLRRQLVVEAEQLQRLTDPYCARRPRLDEIQQRMQPGEEQDLLDALQQQRQEIFGVMAREYEASWEQSGEQFLASMEQVIRLNRDLFPVLTRYCLDRAA
jgi:hypothetical protein